MIASVREISTSKHFGVLDVQEEYLSPDQVSVHYPGLSTRWLARQRWEHGSLPYIKAGKRVLYRRADIEQYLRTNTIDRGGYSDDARA